MTGGTFLILLFLHWLFLEPKNYGLPGERFLHKQGTRFYAWAALLAALLLYFAWQQGPFLAYAAILGCAVFFILDGLKSQRRSCRKATSAFHGYRF